ncbi:sensor histidine kinase [Streptomonospora wellingtoniae]|uniref:histidine kinase n=1 Tax=Streptomonospora wellingtoniae TaxID=3075544 RepID=A0ABU2KWZ4_9ACTN|nr:ATP-binding protein [Streptomonospora sp. DSM 45055]MDT0303563.1 ATP-binding protein [Streptomonospora sp. DSM 45055]
MTADDNRPSTDGRFRRLLRRLGLSRRDVPPARHEPPAAAPAPHALPQPPPGAGQWYPGSGAHVAQPALVREDVRWGGQSPDGFAHRPPVHGQRQAEWVPPAEPHEPVPDPNLLTEALAGLAMRDLTMVESLLDIVGSLEDSTEDPDLLAKLFEIDNLATRMRRNGENLLVLADQESDDSGMEPVALLDVARAATSEIKNYSRVQIGRLPDRFIAGEAADDLSHLLAELLDNATNHSPDHAQVVISGQMMPDGGLLVIVEDEGIGVPQDQLADINSRLAGTPVLDKRVMRHMGLYVASRIAHRHGLRVQLEARAFRGVSAYTVVPAEQLSTSGPTPVPGVPTQAAPAMAAASPQPSAGFHRSPPAPGAVSGPSGSGQSAPQPQNGATSAVTAAGLPRRTAHQSPLRMMQAEASAPEPAAGPGTDPASGPEPSGGRAERIRDELGGFMEGERAATREGGRAEGDAP